MSGTYDPVAAHLISFYDAVSRFATGTDSPSAYLERCIATIGEREPVVRAWASTRLDEAQEDAAASTARYAAGTPLSPIDGMPIGLKDLMPTRDLPTSLGIDGNDDAMASGDSAPVQALRAAGAVIVGKTVTTELGGVHSSRTANPFSATHTPGGSSSGSAAAVSAGMVPAALGSQLGGSIIRPAGFCGAYALKPTVGAVNRGESDYSHSVTGVLAGSLEDVWMVCSAIVERVGGDPGYHGLYGPPEPPAALRPARVAVLETAGWTVTPESTRAAFDEVLAQLRDRGVAVLRRGDLPELEAFELEAEQAGRYGPVIMSFEGRWALENYVRNFALSAETTRYLEHGRSVSLRDYREALIRRQAGVGRLAELAPHVDAFLSPTAPGPAIPLGDVRFPTGNGVYNMPTSVLGMPAVAVPLMAVDGLPVGLQLSGQRNDDYRLIGYGRWIVDNLDPVRR